MTYKVYFLEKRIDPICGEILTAEFREPSPRAVSIESDTKDVAGGQFEE